MKLYKFNQFKITEDSNNGYNNLSNDKSDINILMNITINKFGGFEIGEGEYFTDYDKLFNNTPDFYIQTLFEAGVYTTYFIPNPVYYQEAIDGKYTDKDFIKMFTEVTVCKTTEEQIKEYIKNNPKIGLYEIKLDDDPIVITDMMWFYLGLSNAGEMEYFDVKEISNGKLHPKYQEILSLKEKYKK
jgi:hypothetical protein